MDRKVWDIIGDWNGKRIYIQKIAKDVVKTLINQLLQSTNGVNSPLDLIVF